METILIQPKPSENGQETPETPKNEPKETFFEGNFEDLINETSQSTEIEDGIDWDKLKDQKVEPKPLENSPNEGENAENDGQENEQNENEEEPEFPEIDSELDEGKLDKISREELANTAAGVVDLIAMGLDGGLNWYAQNDPKSKEYRLDSEQKKILRTRIVAVMEYYQMSEGLNPVVMLGITLGVIAVPMALKAHKDKLANIKIKQQQAQIENLELQIKQSEKAEKDMRKKLAEQEVLLKQREIDLKNADVIKATNLPPEVKQKSLEKIQNDVLENMPTSNGSMNDDNSHNLSKISVKNLPADAVKKLKAEARKLRANGATYEQIAHQLNIAHGTISGWVANVEVKDIKKPL